MTQANGLIDSSLKYRCKRFGSLLRHFCLGIYTIETTIDDQPLKILVADDGSTLEHIQILAHSENMKICRKGTIDALHAPKLLASDADIVIVGASQLLVDAYEKSGFEIVPKWVRLLLPVEEEPYTRLYNKGRQARKYFKWMLKKATDAGFECDIVNSREYFDHFYYNMYTPYALQRFGEHAVVYKYKIVDKVFKQGALGIVKQNGKLIVGTVIYREGDTLRLPHTGIAEDGWDAVKDGAAFALDYYLAQYAHAQGYRYVNFGHSRPFLSDGTLKYKLNWHMDVLPDDDSMSVYAIATPGCTPQAQKFLAANPHFTLVNGRCVLSNEQPEVVSTAD